MKRNKAKRGSTTTVTVNSELFFAVGCLPAYPPYSFAFIGAQDDTAGKTKVLCTLGKKEQLPDGTKIHPVQKEWSYWFGEGTRFGSLSEFMVPYSNKLTEISYTAYSITVEQYINLIYQVYISKSLHPKYTAVAFMPPSLDDTENEYKLINVHATITDESLTHDLRSKIQPINKNHNCRDAAFALRNIALEINKPKKPTGFKAAKHLNSRTTVKEGRILGPFYILPRKPDKDATNPELYAILLQIYHHLKHLSHTHQTNPLSREKFTAFKELYLQLLEDKDQPITELYETLYNWYRENSDLINQRRSTFSSGLFGRTASRTLCDALLEKDQDPHVLRTTKTTAMQALAKLKVAIGCNRNPNLGDLCHELQQLHDDLFARTSTEKIVTYCRDTTALATAAETMLTKLNDTFVEQTQDYAKQVMQEFQDTALYLSSLEDPTWKTTSHLVGRILIIAACGALAAFAGLFIFGLIVSILTAPATAGTSMVLAGAFSAMLSAALGSSLGLTCGVLAAPAVGGAVGLVVGFYSTNSMFTHPLTRVVNASNKATTHFSEKINLKP